MPLDKRKVASALTSKLNCKESGGDHVFYSVEWEGRQVAYTKMSRGSRREISDSLVGQMARQLQVKRRTFEEIVRCTKYLDDYIAELRAAGVLEDSPPQDS